MPVRLIALVVAAVSIVAVMNGSFLTAAGNIPITRVAVVSRPITAMTLLPNECIGLSLTWLLTGSGNITGTRGAELILGGPAAQTIRGGGGGDCLVGGGGVDHLQGAGGFDVCIGNATTIFNNCNKVYIK